jgi:hypothetical protein
MSLSVNHRITGQPTKTGSQQVSTPTKQHRRHTHGRGYTEGRQPTDQCGFDGADAAGGVSAAMPGARLVGNHARGGSSGT